MRCCQRPRKARGKRSRATSPPPIPSSRVLLLRQRLRRTRAHCRAVPRRPARQTNPSEAASRNNSCATVAQYQRDDVHQALERACRVSAFSLAAVRAHPRRLCQAESVTRTNSPESASGNARSQLCAKGIH